MILFICGTLVLGNCKLLTLNLFFTSNRKRGQSLRLRFPGIAKHPNCFERVMCPRYRVSIHLYSCSFLLFGDFGKQDRKADAISMSFYSKLYHRSTNFIKLGTKIRNVLELRWLSTLFI